MKLIFIFLLIILGLSCTSLNKQASYFSSFDKLQEFKIGQTSPNTIENKLGMHSSRAEFKDSYQLSFTDPNTQMERLHFRFSKNTDLLSEIIWIPLDEKESLLEGAKSQFPSSIFEEVKGEVSKHRVFPAEATLIDRKNGISILYDLNKQRTVQAIAIYEKQDRTPAELKK